MADRMRAQQIRCLILAWFILAEAAGLHSASLSDDSIHSVLEDAPTRKRSIVELDAVEDSSEDRKYRGKADIENCSGLSFDSATLDDAPPPCRLPTFQTTVDKNGTIVYEKRKPPPNQLTIGLFVGITPKKHSIGPLVTDILTSSWDADLDNMNFHLHDKYNDQYPSDSNDQNGNRLRRQELPDRDPNSQTTKGQQIPSQDRAARGNRRALATRYRLRSRRKTEKAQVVNLYHAKSDSRLADKHLLRWWWLVNITYECYWDDGEPVENTIMDEIYTNISSSFVSIQRSVKELLQEITRDGALRVRIDKIPLSAEDDIDTEDERRPSKDKSFNSQDWDWSRYAGLVLIVGTLSIAILLRFFSARRQHQREQKHVWGNLASNEGVDRLLSAGWALEGSNLHIYDKSKVGYKDDDSVFLGGYEQRETVVGADVTVTHPETTASPDDGATRPSA